MEIVHQVASLILPLGLFIACLYVVFMVRRTIEQLQKFERLFRTMREANTKVRFMASRVKDKVALLDTTVADLQAQIDILLHTSTNLPNSKESINDPK